MNYLRTNELTKNLLNSLRIMYYNNNIEVEMYEKIIDFTNEKIILEKIIIYGVNLQITYIDKYLIKIKGKVTKIEGKNETKL